MAADPLLERVQRAIAPDYRVEHEIARGGMGVVFRAHDLTLDAPVAVKVLRPELDTAHAAEAFLREARILARVRHPNIVAIYHAGEAEGLHYYIMEFVAGPTLQARLAAGPLAPAHARKLGRDLLDGLEAVHGAGVVHRDLKPSNVFLTGTLAKVADFGIARAPSTALHRTRRSSTYVEGTPGYMAPEQMAGDSITPLTDVYAAAAVLYEAYTGTQLPPPEARSWRRVPRLVAPILKRALADDPAERWPDVRTFRRALWRTRTVQYVVRTMLLTLAGLVVGAGVASRLFQPGRVVATGSVTVAVPAFEFTGPRDQRPIADSLAQLVRAELRGHPNLRITAAGRDLPWSRAAVRAQGQVTISDAEMRVRLTDRNAPAGGAAPVEARAPVSRWRELTDSLTYGILLAVWNSKSPLAASLPRQALPRTPQGLVRFLAAEQLVAAGTWGDAYRAYLVAEEADSTCWLCSWRLNEVERWLGLPHDPARVRRYLAHVDSFPPAYQSLIRAGQLPLTERLDTLRAAWERWPGFFLAAFQYGDEMVHRGPLIGRRRGEAVAAFERAARLRPDFGPAWEHLAWVSIAEGDSAAARRALRALASSGEPRDPFSRDLRSLLDLGYAWRFAPRAQALAVTQRLLSDTATQASPNLGAGPRLLPSFDAPHGAVMLGEYLAGTGTADLRRSGLIAQALGLVAVGEPDQARAAARRLAALSPEPEIALFVAELEAVLGWLDPSPTDTAAATRELERWAGPAGGALRPRAVWMRALLARRTGRPADPLTAAALPATGHAAALALFLAADSLALTDTVDADSVARYVDPFFRTVMRLERARWSAAVGDPEGARRELRWREHWSLHTTPIGLPQPGEIDWAFGTVARWRLAQLDLPRDAELCDADRGVARLWNESSTARYRARADSARERLQRHDCPRAGA